MDQQDPRQTLKSPAWDRFVHEAPTSDVSVPRPEDSDTRPAPFVEDPSQEEALIGSIPLRALQPVYAPVVDLCTGRTVAFDCQLRCLTEGLTEPRELLARASFEHRLADLGRVGRELSLRECPGRAVFIAVHQQELPYPALLRRDDPMYSHDAEVFVLLQQRSYSQDCLRVTRSMCQHGNVKLAVDDFGDTTSNLNGIIDLSPSIVKLDERLVGQIAADSRRREAVTRLVELLASLGAHAVAKGLTSTETLCALRDCGVRFGQGALFGALSATPMVSRYSDL